MSDLDEAERLEELRRFKREEDARRRAVRSQFSDSWTVCLNCRWKERTSICIAERIKVCPRCGNNQCVRETLDYDHSVPTNPLPSTEAEIRNIERQNRRLLGRYGG